MIVIYIYMFLNKLYFSTPNAVWKRMPSRKQCVSHPQETYN